MSEPENPEKRARAPFGEVRRSGSKEAAGVRGLAAAVEELAETETALVVRESLAAARDRLRSDLVRLEKTAVPGNTGAARELLGLRLEALERSIEVEPGAGRLPRTSSRSDSAAARDGTILRPFVTLSPVRKGLAGLAKTLGLEVDELLVGAAYELQERYSTFRDWLTIWHNLTEEMTRERLMPDRVAITVGMGHGEYCALVGAVAREHVRRANEALLFERSQEMLNAAFKWGQNEVSAKDRIEILRATQVLPTPQAGGGLSVNVHQQVGVGVKVPPGAEGPSFAEFMRQARADVKTAANDEAGTDHRAWRPDSDEAAIEAEIVNAETEREGKQL